MKLKYQLNKEIISYQIMILLFSYSLLVDGVDIYLKVTIIILYSFITHVLFNEYLHSKSLTNFSFKDYYIYWYDHKDKIKNKFYNQNEDKKKR